jgi:hypothetical protein
MKILMASTPATGHINPLLAVGHVLAVSNQREDFGSEAVGFRPLSGLAAEALAACLRGGTVAEQLNSPPVSPLELAEDAPENPHAALRGFFAAQILFILPRKRGHEGKVTGGDAAQNISARFSRIPDRSRVRLRRRPSPPTWAKIPKGG